MAKGSEWVVWAVMYLFTSHVGRCPFSFDKSIIYITKTSSSFSSAQHVNMPPNKFS